MTQEDRDLLIADANNKIKIEGNRYRSVREDHNVTLEICLQDCYKISKKIIDELPEMTPIASIKAYSAQANENIAVSSSKAGLSELLTNLLTSLSNLLEKIGKYFSQASQKENEFLEVDITTDTTETLPEVTVQAIQGYESSKIPVVKSPSMGVSGG